MTGGDGGANHHPAARFSATRINSPSLAPSPSSLCARATACAATAGLKPRFCSADAVSALQNLGFKPAIAAQAVARAQSELGEGASEGELIRVALKRAAG